MKIDIENPQAALEYLLTQINQGNLAFVTRCKDCEHWHEDEPLSTLEPEFCRCDLHRVKAGSQATDFCSFAFKREEKARPTGNG